MKKFSIFIFMIFYSSVYAEEVGINLITKHNAPLMELSYNNTSITIEGKNDKYKNLSLSSSINQNNQRSLLIIRNKQSGEQLVLESFLKEELSLIQNNHPLSNAQLIDLSSHICSKINIECSGLVVILSTYSKTNLQEIGFEPGDIIYQVGDIMIQNKDELYSILKEKSPKRVFKIIRDNKQIKIEIPSSV